MGYNGEVKKDTQILAVKVKWRPHRQTETRRRCEERNEFSCGCATSIWSSRTVSWLDESRVWQSLKLEEDRYLPNAGGNRGL